jgi:hypothetical protein
VSLKNLKLLNEICEVQPCHKGEDYCLLKEIIKHDAKYNDRLIMQIALIDKFKYERSEKTGKDIGWEKAFNLFVDEGFAKKFADLWNEDETINSLWKKMKNGKV